MTNENLVSVNIATEQSFTGKTQTRIYLKMYVNAVHSGLIADMGAERWQTLCTVAAFMNEKGECYPTQDRIADSLNVRRETANRRIKKLCEYRWNGRPLVVKEQSRHNETQKFENTRYKIMPISQLAIFDGEAEDI